MEMICAIVKQLTQDLSPEEIKRSGFGTYYVDHTLALWPQAASGTPWTATYLQSKGDPITDLTDNSGGTPSDTIPVLACESGCDCKHAIASLTKKTNTILAALRAVGIIASE